MQEAPINVPSDVAELKNIIADLHHKLQQKEIEQQQTESQLKQKEITLQYKEQRISLLEHQLRSALQFRFGKKSEKLTDRQLDFFDEALLTEEEKPAVLQADEAITVARFTHPKGGRKPLPADLPREQVIHDLPEAEKTCACGCALHKIGEDKSEQLEFVPARVRVLEHIRYKYACRACEEGIKMAPLPPQPIPKSIATPGLLAHVLVSKYHDHIPLYRQEHILQRYQIDITRGTLCHWVLRCGELFQPFIELIKKQVIQTAYLCVDETPVQVLAEKDKINSSKSYMWVYLTGLPPPDSPRFILYDYQPTRGGDAATALLAGFKGYLQTDGYGGYHALQAQSGITAVGCWAHVRRKFMDIVKIDKTEGKAFEVIKIIKQLYALEKEMREKQLSFDDVKQERQQKAKPIIEYFKNWLEQTLTGVPPQSPIAKAIGYALNQWPMLLTYLESGELMIDNNHVENAIRPFALGRKNWLFLGNERGAKAAANIYSLIMTAKANQLEPYRYLRYLLQKLPHCKTDEQRTALFPPNCSAEFLANLY